MIVRLAVCLLGSLIGVVSTVDAAAGQYATPDMWEIAAAGPRLEPRQRAFSFSAGAVASDQGRESTDGRQWGRNIKRGAWIGAGAGALMYAGVVLSLHTGHSDGLIFDPYLTALILPVTGAMYGAGIGFTWTLIVG